MKKFIKLFTLFMIIINIAQITEAKLFANPISKAIKKADISNSALISVSFKELATGKSDFELNQKTPMSPASIQKVATMLPSIDILGQDYEFKTQLYKNKNNSLFIKLGADPYLTKSDLKDITKLMNNAKISAPKIIYIDDAP